MHPNIFHISVSIEEGSHCLKNFPCDSEVLTTELTVSPEDNFISPGQLCCALRPAQRPASALAWEQQGAIHMTKSKMCEE